ncbi:MAG: homocysteine S-methyltransferase family protein [Actinomycetota bacterium]
MGTTTTTTDSHSSSATVPPATDRPVRITDGGLETFLIFHDKIELPDFASFPLVTTIAGRAALRRYYQRFLDVATDLGVGIVLDTPTWRASADWGARLGYDTDHLADINSSAVSMIRAFAQGHTDVVINGVIGPRGDGYEVGATMRIDEAVSYHGLQARAFAASEVDTVTAVTMTYVDEAIGVVRACERVGVPVVVGFTVETDGRLPSGQPLGDAITAVDEATDRAPVDFMVNCAHPSHFAGVLDGNTEWCSRIGAIRPNASRMSHEELDNATELDRGDPSELATESVALRAALPNIRVVGGCCGTDDEHVAALATAFAAAPAGSVR